MMFTSGFAFAAGADVTRRGGALVEAGEREALVGRDGRRDPVLVRHVLDLLEEARCRCRSRGTSRSRSGRRPRRSRSSSRAACRCTSAPAPPSAASLPRGRAADRRSCESPVAAAVRHHERVHDRALRARELVDDVDRLRRLLDRQRVVRVRRRRARPTAPCTSSRSRGRSPSGSGSARGSRSGRASPPLARSCGQTREERVDGRVGHAPHRRPGRRGATARRRRTRPAGCARSRAPCAPAHSRSHASGRPVDTACAPP